MAKQQEKSHKKLLVRWLMNIPLLQHKDRGREGRTVFKEKGRSWIRSKYIISYEVLVQVVIRRLQYLYYYEENMS